MDICFMFPPVHRRDAATKSSNAARLTHRTAHDRDRSTYTAPVDEKCALEGRSCFEAVVS